MRGWNVRRYWAENRPATSTVRVETAQYVATIQCFNVQIYVYCICIQPRPGTRFA